MYDKKLTTMHIYMIKFEFKVNSSKTEYDVRE